MNRVMLATCAAGVGRDAVLARFGDEAIRDFPSDAGHTFVVSASAKRVRARLKAAGAAVVSVAAFEGAPTDCGCVHHHGPHWLYLDVFDRRGNVERLERAIRNPDGYRGWLGMHGFARCEAARLGELEHQMRAHRVEDCREVPGYACPCGCNRDPDVSAL